MSNLSSQEGALFVRQDNADLREFLNACVAGDTIARQHFQAIYGENIYNFPVKICGTSIEEAGDYYLYVFERDRIFLRLKTFAGRNNIQFRTFLSYYVLKHLFVEWRRNRKEIDTISLQTPIDDADDGHKTLEDILPSVDVCDCTGSDQELTQVTTTILNSLTSEDRLYLKLLSLLEYHLSPEDVRLLACISRRTIDDTLMLLTEIHNSLKRKDEKVACLRNDLDSVWGWIVLRQKERQKLISKLSALSTMENMRDTELLLAQKLTLENTLARRIRQRERLIEKLQTYKLTPPYKDIARLLNTTTASVYSRIFRLREQLIRVLATHPSLPC